MAQKLKFEAQNETKGREDEDAAASEVEGDIQS